MRETLCRGGGKDLVCDKHPTSLCGGTIVNQEWILTSGHCCNNADFRPGKGHRRRFLGRTHFFCITNVRI